MNPNKLTIGTQLKSRSGKSTPAIEDYQPAALGEVQQWLVKGNWLNYAQLDARYTIYSPTGRAPKNKKQKAL